VVHGWALVGARHHAVSAMRRRIYIVESSWNVSVKHHV
jgi:hypothetical protein